MIASGETRARLKTTAYFVFSLHIYFRAETILQIVAAMGQALRERGMGNKPIRTNETNAPPTDDPGWPLRHPLFQLDLEQQAAYIVQAAVLVSASGIERIAVYKLYDQQLPIGGESFGLVNPSTWLPRQTYSALKAVVELISSVNPASRSETDQVKVINMLVGDNHQSSVAWNRLDSPALLSLGATGSKAYLADQKGSLTTICPENDA